MYRTALTDQSDPELRETFGELLVRANAIEVHGDAEVGALLSDVLSLLHQSVDALAVTRREVAALLLAQPGARPGQCSYCGVATLETADYAAYLAGPCDPRD